MSKPEFSSVAKMPTIAEDCVADTCELDPNTRELDLNARELGSDIHKPSSDTHKAEGLKSTNASVKAIPKTMVWTGKKKWSEGQQKKKNFHHTMPPPPSSFQPPSNRSLPIESMLEKIDAKKESLVPVENVSLILGDEETLTIEMPGFSNCTSVECKLRSKALLEIVEDYCLLDHCQVKELKAERESNIRLRERLKQMDDGQMIRTPNFSGMMEDARNTSVYLVHQLQHYQQHGKFDVHDPCEDIKRFVKIINKLEKETAELNQFVSQLLQENQRMLDDSQKHIDDNQKHIDEILSLRQLVSSQEQIIIATTQTNLSQIQVIENIKQSSSTEIKYITKKMEWVSTKLAEQEKAKSEIERQNESYLNTINELRANVKRLNLEKSLLAKNNEANVALEELKEQTGGSTQNHRIVRTFREIKEIQEFVPTPQDPIPWSDSVTPYKPPTQEFVPSAPMQPMLMQPTFAPPAHMPPARKKKTTYYPKSQ